MPCLPTMQSRGLRIQKMYLTSGNSLTIQGKVNVVSGIFHPLVIRRVRQHALEIRPDQWLRTRAECASCGDG